MDINSKKPTAQYESGQLDKTRKNLGLLGKEESDRMMKVLGGEIGKEKYNPTIDENLKKTSSNRKYVQTRSPHNLNNDKRNSTSKNNNTQQSTVAANSFVKKQILPSLSPSEKQLFDRLMTSSEYNIKPNLTFFAILFSFGRLNREQLSSHFIQKELTIHMQHIDIFIDTMHQLILAVPGEYKQKIQNNDDPHFKTLRMIYEWDTHPVKTLLSQLRTSKSAVTVEDTIPFIKELFQSLLPFYFLGESKMTTIIKQLYAVAIEVTTDNKEKKLAYAKQAAGEWIYICGQIIKGLYPLLMRMTISECDIYPDFYTKHISKILQFLKMTKYDLVLPKKQKNTDSQTTTSLTAKQADSKQDRTEVATTQEPVLSKQEKAIELRKSIPQNLELLDRLFPKSGWTELEKIPDMYSYFHPLYQFQDGFNLLSPANPLQVTIVLLRIIEDFFQACRNISFNIDKDENYILEDDNLQKIFAEWAQYREIIFDKIMSPDLRDYVNHIYAQNDFKKSKYGTKQLSNWLWQMKYYFHPHLAFELVFIERPSQDDTYKSLPQRIHHAQEIFASLVRDATTDEGSKKANFTTPYQFDMENTISYRLDILLGGKKSKARTNLNLLKYTLCALRTLDWWINDKESLAYRDEIKVPYRAEGDDGEPSFIAPVRSDQKALFVHYAKKLLGEKGNAAKKSEQKNSTENNTQTPN